MPVANDIVDLKDPETRPEAVHPRFDERVFSAGERQRIQLSPASHRERWALWAAKESSFKLAKKLDPRAVFSPIRFHTTMVRDGLALVRHRDIQFSVAFVEQSPERVHAVAICASPDVIVQDQPGDRWAYLCGEKFLGRQASRRASVVWAVQKLGSTQQDPREHSSVARRLAKRRVGGLLNINPEQIEITSQHRVPKALWRGSPLPVDISLSHHGRFVAFACGCDHTC